MGAGSGSGSGVGVRVQAALRVRALGSRRKGSVARGRSAKVRIPPHLDSDSSGNWTAIPRLTGQLNRVASGLLIVLDPVDGWKGLRVLIEQSLFCGLVGGIENEIGQRLVGYFGCTAQQGLLLWGPTQAKAYGTAACSGARHGRTPVKKQTTHNCQVTRPHGQNRSSGYQCHW